QTAIRAVLFLREPAYSNGRNEKESGGKSNRAAKGKFSGRGGNAAVRTAMQDQSLCLSLGNRWALRTALIVCRPMVAAPLRPIFGSLMGRRSESWSIGHWRARNSDANPGWRISVPSSDICAAEKTQHAKQNANRCGASGRDPGRRGKGQSRRGI